MKNLLITFPVLALAAASSFAQGANGQAGDKTPPPPPRSAFTQPTNSKEGRDPFWPESNRVWQSNEPLIHNNNSVEATTLKVDGYSIVGGRPIIIINKVSFLAGDEADLPAPNGGHSHVHCIDIESDHVVVEVNGARREIRF